MVLCLALYDLLVLLWSGMYSGLCIGTQETNVSLSALAWEAFWKATLIAPRVAAEKSKSFNGEELDIRLGCHQVYS